MPTDVNAPTVVAEGSAESAREIVGSRYEILGLLGAGGMGSVYRARDRELDELVAVKVLRPELLGSPGALERFRRELKLARRVTHPNVARVFDMSEHGGDKILTMELVEGEALSALIAREAPLTVARAVEIASSIAAGAAAAHAAGVVHRDLKPDNVLLAKDGRVVVTDFGVARAASGDASRTGGAFIGTPAYMAPEQIEAPAAVDQRADVYALGAVLYEMLVGEIPFVADSVLAIAAARLLRPPPDPRDKRPDLPAALAELVLRCMARAPDARPPSMTSIAASLASITMPTNPPVAPARSEIGAPLATSGRRVAVLPFANQGPEAQQYVADALTDDLIDALTSAKDLRVRARGVVAKHATRDRDIRDVGRELGVDVVVEGAIRGTPRGTFRVTARVVGVADGYQLWAKRFEVGEAELLASCDVVAEAVAGALGATLPGEARRPAENPEAVEAYLRAREAHRRSFEKDRSRAVALFERARELAPDDPRVLAGFASALLRSIPGPGMVPRARAAVERAVAIAPSLPEVRVAAAQLASSDGNWAGCVAELRRAIRAAPSHGEAHDVLGRVLIEADDEAHGAAHLETALAIDPGLDFARVGLARHAYLAGDAARAHALLDVEGHRVLLPAWSRLALWTRDVALARELRPLVSPDSPQLAVSGYMIDLIVDGTPPPVRFSLSPDVPLPLTTRLFFGQLEAEIASFMGELGTALAAVTSADANGLPDLAWIRRCPLLDPLRGERSFREALVHVEGRAGAIRGAYLTPAR